MDIATIVGLIVAFVLVTSSVAVGGGQLEKFIDPASVMVVIGGMMAATMMSFPLRVFLNVFRVGRKAFHWHVEPVSSIIQQLVSLGETARRDGLLALEKRLVEVDNPFIELGVQMAVDGTRPEVMEEILRDEMNAIATRHREGRALVETMGRYAPAYGMIGTLLGLIIMLGDMNDPSTIGPGMALALLTTLYGALAANALLLPFADKLAYTSRKELVGMEVVVRGLLAIQAGENPRIIGQKLQAFIPPEERDEEDEAA